MSYCQGCADKDMEIADLKGMARDLVDGQRDEDRDRRLDRLVALAAGILAGRTGPTSAAEIAKAAAIQLTALESLPHA